MKLQKAKVSTFEIGLWVVLVICVIAMITFVIVAVTSGILNPAPKDTKPKLIKEVLELDADMKHLKMNDTTKMDFSSVRNMANLDNNDRLNLSETGSKPFVGRLRAKRSLRKIRFRPSGPRTRQSFLRRGYRSY